MSFSIITNIYYFFALCAFIWMAVRYRNCFFLFLVLCLGFEGTIYYWIPLLTATRLRGLYMIIISYMLYENKVWNIIRGKMKLIIWTFIPFIIYFAWANFYIHDEKFLLTIGYMERFYIPFATMFMIGNYYYKRTPAFMLYFNKFFGEFILIQIFTGVLKFILFRGQPHEGLMGTFGEVYMAGTGTSFPLAALAWVLVNTNMDIRGWKSWLFIFGLLFLGIAAGKRAIIVLFPIFFLMFAMYVAKKRYKKGVVSAILLLPVFFYLGLRLTPSLNPEDKVWGSYNPEFALHYAQDYSMGKKNKQGDRGKGNGRVGATMLFINQIIDVDSHTRKTYFGHGIERIYGSRIMDNYSNRAYLFGVDSAGSLTGFAKLYLSIGLVGLVLFMLYYWAFFIPATYWRLRLSLYGLVMFDFFFYNAQTIHTPILGILLCFIMYYSRLQYKPSGKFVGRKHKYFA